MAKLLKNGSVVDDPWTALDDDAPLPADGTPVIVSLARWRAEREALIASGSPLGVRLEPGDHPDAVADDIEAFDLIALTFPAFTDGRAYSYARILRERLDFVGELRAVGDVLRDQFLAMHRCGFDAFAVKKDADADAEAFAHALSIVSAAYQPALDERRLRAAAGAARLAA
jgi:uncharacterized protein (DUF934 family)